MSKVFPTEVQVGAASALTYLHGLRSVFAVTDGTILRSDDATRVRDVLLLDEVVGAALTGYRPHGATPATC